MSDPREPEDFYVGYHPKMPRGLARFVVPLVAVLVAGAASLAIGIPALHAPGDDARSDFGDVREFDGILLAHPTPHLVLPRPGATGGRAFSRYLLVGRGKSGPKIDVAALDGRPTRVKGSLLYRENQTLLAVKGAELLEDRPDLGAARATAPDSLGRFTLQGEIVDSKCFMGTMRPGNTKTHRMCAARCIAGGVPPVLLVRDAEGNAIYFVLVGSDGSAVNEQVLDLVAEPVEIEGEVIRLDDLFVMRSDPATYRRL